MKIYTIVVTKADGNGTDLVPPQEIQAETSKIACGIAWQQLTPQQQDQVESIEMVEQREA